MIEDNDEMKALESKVAEINREIEAAKSDQQNILNCLYKHLQTDNKAYYMNSMKGFHKPFYYKVQQKSLMNQFRQDLSQIGSSPDKKTNEPS